MFKCNSVTTNGTNFLGRTNCVLSVVILYNMTSYLLINNFSMSPVVHLFFRSVSLEIRSSSV